MTPIAKPPMAPATEPYRKAFPFRQHVPVPPRGESDSHWIVNLQPLQKGWTDNTGQDPSRHYDDQGHSRQTLQFSVIPTAMAVVTDLGKREMARKSPCQKIFATMAVKLVLTTTASRLPKRILPCMVLHQMKTLIKRNP